MKKLTLFLLVILITFTAFGQVFQTAPDDTHAVKTKIQNDNLTPSNSPTNELNVGDIVINEFMALNQNTQQDPGGSYADWIELYNKSSTILSLNGLYLSDNFNNPQKWAFPAGTTIAANGYLIIWADDDSVSTDALHAYFKLSGGGERIILSNSNGTVLDSVTFGQQTVDISTGRFPNGTGNFGKMSPTFNAQNSVFTSLNNVTFCDKLNVFPNPANDLIFLQNKNDENFESVSIFNRMGQKVMFSSSNKLENGLNISHLAAGIYTLVLVRKDQQIMVNRFTKH